jgi:hypothetical protein
MSEIARYDIEGLYAKIRSMNQNGELWTQEIDVEIAPI